MQLWAQSGNRKPLLLRGARQVGKTVAVELFSKSFDNFISINLDEPGKADIFGKNMPVEDLFQAICLENGVRAFEDKTLLFLDEIQDPGNIGTLIRTADAAGFTGVILKKGCTDPYSQKALRSSMGSIMSIPILINQNEDVLETFEAYTIYGAALEGGISYKKVNYSPQTILIIGNEASRASGLCIIA